jgi:hypothetical protein
MQANDLDALLKGKWAMAGRLIVPYSLLQQKPKSEIDLAMLKYTTYEELFGSKYDQERLEANISRFSVYDCVMFLSKVAMTLENDGYFNQVLQEAMTRQLLSPDLSSRILRLRSKDPNRIVFHEQQIYNLMKTALLYASEGPPTSFDERKTFFAFSDLLIAITDLLDTDYFDKVSAQNDKRNLLTSMAIRSMYLNAQDDFRYLTGRYHDLFLEIPKLKQFSRKKDCPDFVDLVSEFKEATKIRLTTYMQLGFSLIAQFSQPSVLKGRLSPDHWQVNKDTYYQNTRLTEDDQEKILSHFAVDREGFVKAFKEEVKRTGSFDFSFLTMRNRPLLKVDDKIYVPMSLRFLKEKITAGIYWTIFDHLKDKYGDEGWRRFTRYFGLLFQHYVEEIFRRMVPDSPILAKRLFAEQTYKVGRNTQRTSDIMVIYGKEAVFVEVTAKRLNATRTAIPGNIESFEQDIDQLVVRNAKQLDRVIDHFRQNFFDLGIDPHSVERFYPVIITIEEFPQMFLIRERIDKGLRDAGYLQKPFIDGLQIMDIEELEMIEPIVKSGKSLLGLLKARAADMRYKNLSIKQFLLADCRTPLPENQYLTKRFTNEYSSATQLLFGRPSPTDKL